MTPPDPDLSQYSVMIFCIGLFAVLAAIASASAIWKNVVLIKAAKHPARNPPLGEESAKTYATKEEFQGFKCELTQQCSEKHRRADETFKDLYDKNRELLETITTRFDQYHKDLNQWRLGVSVQLGSLDERTKHP